MILSQNNKDARHRGITPIILATQEADQEDRSLKSAQANSLQDPISKKPITKKGLVE
jgi:hypothetical protein